MCAATAQAVRRNWHATELLAFATQMFIAISAEIADDIGRGFFSQHGTLQGVQNARNVVGFEAAHVFWVEPAWQTFFQHTHRLFLWTLTWPDAERLMNGIYIGGHVFVT